MSNTVVVVGAGASGLMLACELALAGVETVVLERLDRPSEEPRGTTLHARSVDLLEYRGLMEQVRKQDPPEWPIVHFGLMWLDPGRLGDQEYNFVFPDTELIKILEARALELGVDLRRGHEVLNVEQNENGVTVGVRSPAGEARISGAYLVGCDGEHSAIRRLAEFEAPPTGPAWYGIMGHVSTYGDGNEIELYPNGIFGALNDAQGKYETYRIQTIEIDVESPAPDVPVTLDELRGSVRRVTGREREIAEPRFLARYGNRTKLAKSYRKGRAFLVGDAAHVHFFSASHGLNTGLNDAANLGWKLAAEIRGWAPPGLLDTYHSERHVVGHRACMASQAQLSLLHPLEKVGALRELFGEIMKFDDVNRYLVEVITAARYPMDTREGTPAADPHPLLGRTVPDAPLKTPAGETSVACLLRDGKGVVLDLSQGELRHRELTGWSDRVDVVEADPSSALDAAALLIRPDGHIAWIDADGDDEAGLHSSLRKWFGEPSDTKQGSRDA